MRKESDSNDVRRPLAISGPDLGRPVLVALLDSSIRIEVTARLVLAGYRVTKASTLEQLAALASDFEIVVADARLVALSDRATHDALLRTTFIAVCEHLAPTPLGAQARFTVPFDTDDLVNAVATLEPRD